MTAYVTSVQAFEITIAANSTSNTATITSVDTTKAWIWWCGQEISGGTASNSTRARAELTNATTVTVSRNTSSATDTITVRGYVFEGTSSLVSSIQTGTITIAAASASNTATISAVTTSRAVVFYLGLTSNNSTSTLVNYECALDLTNTTTVTASRNSTTGAMTVGYVVVEFQSAAIQSVQQRSQTLTSNGGTFTDTISSVTTANTLIIYNGFHGSTSTETGVYYNLVLTNATTVTGTRTGTATATKTIKYTVLEFVSGVLNVKREGTTAIASAQSADTTITSVNTTYSVVAYGGTSTTASAASSLYPTVKLLDATTIRGNKGVASTVTSTPAWMVAEFTAASDTTIGAGGNRYYNAFIARIGQ